MEIIWRPGTLMEGQLAKHLLLAQGIGCHLAGEHLSGAMGELPAFGLYALMVEPARAAEAADLLRECGLIGDADSIEA